MKKIAILEKDSSLEDLDFKTISCTFGGAPSADTSFAYDLAYYSFRLLLALGEGASHVRG